MKHIERLAREHAAHWTKPRLNEAEQDALAHAYLMGFRVAREKAASLIESFDNGKFNGIPLLLRAIGEGKVEESGDDES
jgi:hypothetical protein